MNRDLDLIIKTQKGPVAPAILDGACWDTERKGTPGKFTFKCIFDELNQFEEGDLVTVKYKNEEVFRENFALVLHKRRIAILVCLRFRLLHGNLKRIGVSYAHLGRDGNG